MEQKDPRAILKQLEFPSYGPNNYKFRLVHWLFFQIREQKEYIRCAQVLAGASWISARRESPTGCYYSCKSRGASYCLILMLSNLKRVVPIFVTDQNSRFHGYSCCPFFHCTAGCTRTFPLVHYHFRLCTSLSATNTYNQYLINKH